MNNPQAAGNRPTVMLMVRATLKAIWDNVAKLPALHPGFVEWTKERAVDPEVTMPYHPAAVQFYL
jgi:TRAP-type uncharacterized transport system substrate-binding protein